MDSTHPDTQGLHPPGDGARTQTCTANSNSNSKVAEDDPADVDRQLIEELLAHYPQRVVEDLRWRMDRLWAQGEYEDRDISGGLWKWHNRPDAGPGLLPYLVIDAWKENRAADAAEAQLAAGRAAKTTLQAIDDEIAACEYCDQNGMTHGDEPRRCTQHRQRSDARRVS
jgi:hypothetical protein